MFALTIDRVTRQRRITELALIAKAKYYIDFEIFSWSRMTSAPDMLQIMPRGIFFYYTSKLLLYFKRFKR